MNLTTGISVEVRGRCLLLVDHFSSPELRSQRWFEPIMWGETASFKFFFTAVVRRYFSPLEGCSFSQDDKPFFNGNCYIEKTLHVNSVTSTNTLSAGRPGKAQLAGLSPGDELCRVYRQPGVWLEAGFMGRECMRLELMRLMEWSRKMSTAAVRASKKYRDGDYPWRLEFRRWSGDRSTEGADARCERMVADPAAGIGGPSCVQVGAGERYRRRWRY